jgi:hypothetical protein
MTRFSLAEAGSRMCRSHQNTPQPAEADGLPVYCSGDLLPWSLPVAYFRFFLSAFSAFSAMRALTIFFTRAAGSGLSLRKWMADLVIS